jgi:hypothetical protein
MENKNENELSYDEMNMMIGVQSSKYDIRLIWVANEILELEKNTPNNYDFGDAVRKITKRYSEENEKEFKKKWKI